MGHHENEWRGSLKVALVAVFVALAGQVVILSDDFGGGNNLRDNGSARMTTTAAVSKAGATETWPEAHFTLVRTGIPNAWERERGPPLR
jgi:hypothetical protein